MLGWTQEEQFLGKPAGIDVRIVTFLDDHRFWLLDGLGHVAIWMTTNTYFIWAVELALIVWVVWSRQWRLSLRLLCAFLIASAFTVSTKAAIRRSRPPADLSLVVAHGSSMPSTHAAFTAALATVLVLTYPWRSRDAQRKAALCAVALVGALGFLLVYVGSHWPSDVLAGWAIGLLLGLACSWPAMRRQARRPAASRGRPADGSPHPA